MAKPHDPIKRREDEVKEIKSQRNAERKSLRNEDPISGESGSHPVTSGVGAAIGGASVGALAGLAAGPVGTVAGAIAGGIAGAYAGKAVGEEVNPTIEREYWLSVYQDRPYYQDGRSFDQYEPAYRLGWDAIEHDRTQSWEEYEKQAKQKWESIETWENEGGAPPMGWDEAKLAVRDSYERSRSRRKAR